MFALGSILVEEMPAERMKLLKILWSKLQTLGTAFEIEHYNALLAAFVDNDHEFSPENFLMAIEEAGLQRDGLV